MVPWSIRVLLSLAFLLAGAPSMAADIQTLEVVEVGLFRAQSAGHVPSPQAVNERTDTLANVVFYSLTTKVPAKQGIRFGTRFRVVGTPANQTVTLRSIWRIPEPGIQNPDTGVLYRQSISDSRSVLGTIGMLGYTFDAPWEIRCGEWIQEVWFGERKLLSQTFTVEDCQGVPTVGRTATEPAG